ncbi:hypothetical protein ABPG77_006429 [Micractinium sp. CCAP 211/92]
MGMITGRNRALVQPVSVPAKAGQEVVAYRLACLGGDGYLYNHVALIGGRPMIIGGRPPMSAYSFEVTIADFALLGEFFPEKKSTNFGEGHAASTRQLQRFVSAEKFIATA